MATSHAVLVLSLTAAVTAAPRCAADVPIPGDAHAPASGRPSYTLRVRPGAASRVLPDRSMLFAVNTPDNRLEVWVTPSGLAHRGSIPVGLEPVAVAARNDCEVWVVNHLSDSVSVVVLDQDLCSRGDANREPATT